VVRRLGEGSRPIFDREELKGRSIAEQRVIKLATGVHDDGAASIGADDDGAALPPPQQQPPPSLASQVSQAPPPSMVSSHQHKRHKDVSLHLLSFLLQASSSFVHCFFATWRCLLELDFPFSSLRDHFIVLPSLIFCLIALSRASSYPYTSNGFSL